MSKENCPCWVCQEKSHHFGRFMIVCPLCGNKRCPRASNHENTCTASNEPGQPGSKYVKIESSKE